MPTSQISMNWRQNLRETLVSYLHSQDYQGTSVNHCISFCYYVILSYTIGLSTYIYIFLSHLMSFLILYHVISLFFNVSPKNCPFIKKFLFMYIMMLPHGHLYHVFQRFFLLLTWTFSNTVRTFIFSSNMSLENSGHLWIGFTWRPCVLGMAGDLPLRRERTDLTGNKKTDLTMKPVDFIW